MISFFRRALKSPLLLGLVALVIVAFIITGIGDPLGGGGGGDAQTVARVGDRQISVAQLSEQFDRRMQIVRREDPELTAEAAVEQGALPATLNQLIMATALAELAEDMGLRSSKRLVDADIASMEAFMGPTGQFSEQTYRDVLSRQNINEASLRRDIEGDVLRRQILAPVNGLSPVPEGVAEPFARLQLEQRTLNIGAVPFALFDDLPAPSAEEVQDYYRRNIARFTIPERRQFRYALIDREAIAADVEVGEAEIARFYERNEDLYGASEQRTLRQVVTQDEEQARTIAARVRGGEDFAAVAAEELGYEEGDLTLGTLTEGELAGTVNPDVASAAFAAPEGSVVGPRQSDFGYHVLVVDDLRTARARGLAEVSGEIRERLVRERTEERLAELIGEAEDAFADGASLSEVAEELELEVEAPPALTQAGRTPEEPGFQLDERLTPLLAAAFDFDVNEDPVAEEIGDGLFALFDVEEQIGPRPMPLAQIREQVAAQLKLERQIAAAEEAADEIAEAVRAGASMRAELNEIGAPPPQELTARRVELAAQGQQLPAFIALGFVQQEGEVATVPAPEQGASVIVHTADVVPGRLEDAPTFLQTVRSQLRGIQQTELQLAFANAVREHVGVEINSEALAALEARYRGDALADE